MKRSLYEPRRVTRLPMFRLTVASMLAIIGCAQRDRDTSVDEKTDLALAELMADGPLAPSMMAPPPTTPLPRRFCPGMFPPPPIDEDGGVSDGMGGGGT